MVRQLPDHPEIECAMRTGYPSWMQESDENEEYTEEDAYDDYCERCYEERRDRELFGD